jgi:hypothetical protein
VSNPAKSADGIGAGVAFGSGRSRKTWLQGIEITRGAEGKVSRSLSLREILALSDAHMEETTV